jgi:hypothetical protein
MSLALVVLGAEPVADAGQRVAAVHAWAVADWQALTAQGVRITFAEELTYSALPDGKGPTWCVEAGVARYLGNWRREDYTTDFERREYVQQMALVFDGEISRTLEIAVPKDSAAG